MPTHYKGKTGAARKKALKEHKAAGRKGKQFGGGFNQPLGGPVPNQPLGGRAPVRPLGFKHGKSAKKK
jgi:hypothetical protein